MNQIENAQLSLFDSHPAAGAADCPHTIAAQKSSHVRRVISASKRTDIPAFYLKEMLRWCQRGWVDVRNPYFGQERPMETSEQRAKRSTHVSLHPEDVIAIVW